MFEGLTRRKGNMNPFVLNVRNLIECPEPLQSCPSALRLINGPTIVVPHTPTSMFVATASPIKTLTVLRL
jgi:hypothetical protein